MTYHGGVRLSDVLIHECLPMVELGLLGFLYETKSEKRKLITQNKGKGKRDFTK